MVRFAAGNRDESIFPCSGAMQVERDNADSHMAFGQGTHFCLGAQLARTEAADCAYDPAPTHG